eukprot:TRINITY_DN1656_c0_g1_i1.p2 TRINITY_DN1656_c0_g1~~TRINITY_DN1656_c0_g1_i1.p2  ORF type:complete len:112 (-),score=20.31 TRINITY_DN1656_c0_g1_i1:619-954(-)
MGGNITRSNSVSSFIIRSATPPPFAVSRENSTMDLHKQATSNFASRDNSVHDLKKAAEYPEHPPLNTMPSEDDFAAVLMSRTSSQKTFSQHPEPKHGSGKGSGQFNSSADD